MEKKKNKRGSKYVGLMKSTIKIIERDFTTDTEYSIQNDSYLQRRLMTNGYFTGMKL